jgi:hypothetical protein
MFKIAAVTLLITAFFFAESHAGTGADWRLVAKDLNNIPSAAGVSALKRIDCCHFTVLKGDSFEETGTVDWPQYDAKAGRPQFRS